MTTKQNNPTIADRLLAGIKESVSTATTPRVFDIKIPEQQVAEAIAYLYQLRCAETGKVANMTDMVVAAINKATHWLVNPDRSGLKILGNPGTGKTTLLYAMREFIGRYNRSQSFGLVSMSVHPALMITDAFLHNDNTYTLRWAVNLPALAIDDVGVEPTEIKYYGSELRPIADILMHRSNENKATIIVSNLGEDEIRVKYGERVCDRMKDMTTILMPGSSNRKNK